MTRWCQRCCSADVIQVTLDAHGEALRFAHCRSCEHRWWARAGSGAAIGLQAVLDRIAAA